MKIIITREYQRDDKIIVQFSTKFGSAEAIWVGDTPINGNVYTVELEISDTLAWCNDIIAADEENYKIYMDNGVMCLKGVLESIEDDGYAIIRMEDSIVSLITQGDPMDIGDFVEAKIKNVTLHNVSY